MVNAKVVAGSRVQLITLLSSRCQKCSRCLSELYCRQRPLCAEESHHREGPTERHLAHSGPIRRRHRRKLLLLIPELCNKVRGVLHYTVVFPPSISFNKHRQTQRPPRPGQSQPTQTHAVAATAAPPQTPTHRKKFGYNISTPFETSTYQSSNRQTKKRFSALNNEATTEECFQGKVIQNSS